MAAMKKTLNLTGVTVNAMALIAPGAFLWITFQVQAAQVDTAGKTTAMDMFAGLFLALILAFLTAISYSMLAEKYPEAGTGSSYYFTEQAFLNEPSKLSAFSRLSKVIVGWFSHLYYWVYPGVMVAMMAMMIVYIFGQFGVNLSPFWQIVVAVVFSFGTGYVAYRGINGSTLTSIVINVIQIVTLVFITVLALIYRFTNPQHVQFVHSSLTSVVAVHSIPNVLFQATIAILLLVGFESATALAAESKSPKHISRGVIISLVLQGLIFYLFEYFGANAWLNNAYTVMANGTTSTGIAAAAASGAPIGDMCKILGDTLLNHSGFALMIVVAISVAIAVFGTTLACMNTGVRVTYAMAQDGEVPSMLNVSAPSACHTAYRSLGNDHSVRRDRRLRGVVDHRFNGGHPVVQHRDLPALWDDQPDRPGGLSAPPSTQCLHAHNSACPRLAGEHRDVAGGHLPRHPGRGHDPGRCHGGDRSYS